MSAEYIRKLDDGRLLVDMRSLPRSQRYVAGAFFIIPERTTGWIKCYCEGRSCLVSEFQFNLRAEDRPLKLMPSKLRCPLCACQTQCFEFQGWTKEETRKVAERNQMKA